MLPVAGNGSISCANEFGFLKRSYIFYSSLLALSLIMVKDGISYKRVRFSLPAFSNISSKFSSNDGDFLF